MFYECLILNNIRL